jgi:[ribosomal protein S5]-alanine N-acetyltransferase
VATTSSDNAPSIGVMRKVGRHIERNPYPDPPWFQVVGVLYHPT